MKERMDDLREASGQVSYSDPLTTFFYLLMRNELAAGKVEELVHESVHGPQECTFTNGWLARYANNLAEEVKNARVIHLQNALTQAFTDAGEEKKEQAKKGEQERLKTKVRNKLGDSLDDDELAKLEQQLIQAAEEGKFTQVGKEVDPRTAVEEAKDAVQQLVSQGHITQEQADTFSVDIDAASIADSVWEETAKNIPKAEEVVKETKEEDKVTTKEAKEIVEYAVELSEAVKELKTHSQEAGVVKEPQKTEDLKVIKNGEEVSDEKWKSEHVTVIDVNKEVTADEIDKWKNTNEELQKIEDEAKNGNDSSSWCTVDDSGEIKTSSDGKTWASWPHDTSDTQTENEEATTEEDLDDVPF